MYSTRVRRRHRSGDAHAPFRCPSSIRACRDGFRRADGARRRVAAEGPGTVTLRRGRHAGVIVPLFSIRSAADWGVGEIPDLGGMAAWLAAAGQGALHTLPLLERAAGERSPYSALSAFAIDP